MNDDIEALLKQLTPRGAGLLLRVRVLDAVDGQLQDAGCHGQLARPCPSGAMGSLSTLVRLALGALTGAAEMRESPLPSSLAFLRPQEPDFTDRDKGGQSVRATPVLSRASGAAGPRFRWDRWLAPVVAALVLLTINLLQAYARLPSSDRQLAGTHITSDGDRLYVYSDLRLELAPSSDSDRLE